MLSIVSRRYHLATVLLNIDETVCHVANTDGTNVPLMRFFQLKSA